MFHFSTLWLHRNLKKKSCVRNEFNTKLLFNLISRNISPVNNKFSFFPLHLQYVSLYAFCKRVFRFDEKIMIELQRAHVIVT